MATRQRPKSVSTGPLWAVVQHDFLQTAQSLRGLGPLVGRRAASGQRDQLEMMVVGLANAMTCMIDLVADITSLESGKLPVPASGISLQAIVEDTIRKLTPVAAERGLTLTATASPGLLAVPDVICRHALLGLALSAIRMARRGEVRIDATIKTRASIVATFTGINPGPAMRRTGIVQWPASASDPENPYVAPGPALLARLAATAGGRLSASTSRSASHKLKLELPITSS